MNPLRPQRTRVLTAVTTVLVAALLGGCATSTSDPWAAADQSGRALAARLQPQPAPLPGRAPVSVDPTPSPAPTPPPVNVPIATTPSPSVSTAATNAAAAVATTASHWSHPVKTAAPRASAGSSGFAAREIRTVRADLWFTGQPAATGYGQYTYIVLLKPTGTNAAATAAANTHLLKLALVHDSANAAEDSLFTRQREINHLLVPVLNKDAPAQLTGAQRTPEAVLPLYHYNYAQTLVTQLGLSGRSGPFIFSSNVPLTPSLELRGQYIVQDLSRCSPEIAEMWWGLFISASNRSNFWEWNDVSGQKLLARFYSGLDLIGTWAPGIQATVREQFAFIFGKN